MSRNKNTPRIGRTKDKRKPSQTVKSEHNFQRNKQAQHKKSKEETPVALTIPSPGWTEWVQSGIDWLNERIFPQANVPGYIDRIYMDSIDSDATDTDNIDTDPINTDTIQAIPLTELNGTEGVIINGAKAWDNSGVMIAGGDANGDGYGDVLVCSPFIGSAGRIDVLSGGANLQSPISLSGPETLLSATGEARGDFLGSAGAIMNGEGDNEGVVVISARYASLENKTWAGKSYLIPGNVTEEVDLSSSIVRKFIGMDAYEQSGSAIALGYRLVDGVMKRLIIITAPFACPANNCGDIAAGRIYGVYDDPDLPNPFYLADLYDPDYNMNGSKGFVIEGIPGQQLGCDVRYIEKLDALLMGAALASPNNKTYAGEGCLLYLDSLFSSSSVFNLADMNEANGHIFYGPHKRSEFATTVDFVEKFFGAGEDALIFGAPNGRPDGARLKAGMAFAVNFASDLPYLVDLSNSTVVQQHAVQFNGASARDNAGIAVRGAGDSIMIAAVIGSVTKTVNQPGLTYVIYNGAFSSFPFPVELSDLNGTQGEQYIGGPPNTTKIINSLCISGSDLNGDGLIDWLISQYTATPNENLTGAGQIYVVYRQAAVSQPYWAQAFRYLSEIDRESVYQATYQATVNGAARGGSRVIEEKLGQQYSPMVSKSAGELVYALSYATFNYWDHYNRAMTEGDELGAAYKAMAETCNDMLIWFAARVFFEGLVAQSCEWIADRFGKAGHSGLAGGFSFFGKYASTLAYFQSAITREGVPGVLTATCALFGGVVGEKVAAGTMRPLLIERKSDKNINDMPQLKV